MYSNEVSARIGSDKGPPRCTQKRNRISGAASGAANPACMSAPLLEVLYKNTLLAIPQKGVPYYCGMPQFYKQKWHGAPNKLWYGWARK